ncbi:antiviral reverse transcriptase Drt3b [Palleronia sp.]|uniref:antiviral reverse transcriptase Drt3b n=1 Tax=Palleronia sp. TaxID=1940284 RepID=UPI0035C87002
MTDVLPFEVPPSFSNGVYFYFLSKYNVRTVEKGKETWVTWEANGSLADTAISAFFAVTRKNPSNFRTETKQVDGKTVRVREWKLGKTWTQPYHFKISHKETEFRQLSIPHPQNQLLVASFYHDYGPLIIYECSKSHYSIRRPAAVARTARFKDRLFLERESADRDSVEQRDAEYKNIGSYFTYESYSNIFRFYENRAYLNAEKKFGRLLKLDISSCFDNIYTQSIVWSVLGHEAAKEDIDATRGTFGDVFDKVMRYMNRGETNGILIGPEFSRMFAEILVQEVDRKLETALWDEHSIRHRVDYEIYRYVDDYFVFTDDPSNEDIIRAHLGAHLKEIKLSLSKEKALSFDRPIITPLTIAKNRVSGVLKDWIRIEEVLVADPDDPDEKIKHFKLSCQSVSLIVDFKTVVHETGVSYKDVLNYSLASVEKRVEQFFKHHERNHMELRKEPELARALIGLLDFVFFAYAAAPRVNFSVRLTRIVCSIVDGLHRTGVARDLKDHVLKFAFDNIHRHIKTKPIDRFREIETLYLILAVEKLGRTYMLPQDVLAHFFGIDRDHGGSFFRKRRLT